MLDHETSLTELQANLVAVAEQLLTLALRVAELTNADHPKRLDEADRLYRERRLNMQLSVGVPHGGEGLRAVQLALTDPSTGQVVAKLVAVNSLPAVGGIH